MVRKPNHKLPLDRPRSVRQNQDPVRCAHRLRKIMGDQDRRFLSAADDRTDIITDRKPRLIIQSRKRKNTEVRKNPEAPSPGSNALNHTSSAPQAPVKHSKGSSATQTNDPSAACTRFPKPPSRQKPRQKESPPAQGPKARQAEKAMVW